MRAVVAGRYGRLLLPDGAAAVETKIGAIRGYADGVALRLYRDLPPSPSRYRSHPLASTCLAPKSLSSGQADSAAVASLCRLPSLYRLPSSSRLPWLCRLPSSCRLPWSVSSCVVVSSSVVVSPSVDEPGTCVASGGGGGSDFTVFDGGGGSEDLRRRRWWRWRHYRQHRQRERSSYVHQHRRPQYQRRPSSRPCRTRCPVRRRQRMGRHQARLLQKIAAQHTHHRPNGPASLPRCPPTAETPLAGTVG